MEEQAESEAVAARAPPTEDDARETPRPRRKKKKKEKKEKKCKADHHRARVSKSPRAIKLEEEEEEQEDGESSGPLFIDPKLRAEMNLAKRMYPGASTWAKDEERLFEMLFLREELPILPSHWEIDFRGVPISERSFSSSSSHGPNPIVYAHIKEFRATMALTRLIDLTANVRTACQSGLRCKAPSMIKKSLDSYMRWAAEDGGFSHLKAVPNMVAEIIDSNEEEASVASIIENRMESLARRQRDYLRDERRHIEFAATNDEGGSEARGLERRRRERRVSSWRAIGSMLMTGFLRLFETRIDIKPDPDADEAEEPDGAAGDEMVLVKVEEDESAGDDRAEQREQQEMKVKEEDEDEDTVMAQLASAPSTPQPQPRSQPQSQHHPQQQHQPQQLPPSSTPYLHPPPVVYGLFIVNTVVFLMTVDSAKGDSAYVSFHVQTDFADRGQSVWNALTMAMVVCVARDEMMSRLEDFEQASVVEESDPDA